MQVLAPMQRIGRHEEVQDQQVQSLHLAAETDDSKGGPKQGRPQDRRHISLGFRQDHDQPKVSRWAEGARDRPWHLLGQLYHGFN
jgi:hypothetical protein